MVKKATREINPGLREKDNGIFHKLTAWIIIVNHEGDLTPFYTPSNIIS